MRALWVCSEITLFLASVLADTAKRPGATLHASTPIKYSTMSRSDSVGRRDHHPFSHPVQPHSEGEAVLSSADPAGHPDIRMNYSTTTTT